MQSQQPQIMTLLNGGDYACAFAEEEGLAEVCRELAPLVEEELEIEVRAIVADLANDDDMEVASRRWSKVSRTVRRRIGHA